jgi:hypothetical protein
MKNIEIIAKIGNFFAVVSAIFAVILAIINYLIIELVSSSAPIDYKIYYIIQAIFPYLLIAVLSIVVAFVCRGVTKETEMAAEPEEVEVPPETGPAEETA